MMDFERGILYLTSVTIISVLAMANSIKTLNETLDRMIQVGRTKMLPFITLDGSTDYEKPDEQKLLRNLMEKYDKFVRPVENASHVVRIHMGLTLTQIFDMDERNQILVTSVWLDQVWTDEFLRWDPDEYGGLHMIRVPCSLIWLPDIVLYNNGAEYTDDRMEANAMIAANGEVFWPVPTKLQSTCKIDVTYFPFDLQRCHLKFGSWTYDGFQVDILKLRNVVDLSNYVVNGEWELIQIKILRNVVKYTCCDEPYPDVTFYIYIGRRTLYYIYNVIFPCILMSLLTLLVFSLPPASGEKITMGITVFLSFSVFMLSVSRKLPETSEFTPLISVYLTIVMSTVTLSVIMTVLALQFHHRGPAILPVPRWLSFFMFKMLAQILCMRNEVNRRKPKRQKVVKRKKEKKVPNKVKTSGSTIRPTTPGTDASSRRLLGSPATQSMSFREISPPVPNNFSKELYPMHMLRPTKEFLRNTQSRQHGKDGHLTKHGRKKHLTQTVRFNDVHPTELIDINLFKTELGKIIERSDREARLSEMEKEWKMVARVYDRLMFFTFLACQIVSTIVILVIMPSLQPERMSGRSVEQTMKQDHSETN